MDKEITQAQVARTHQLFLRTIQRWMKRYREQGLAGLADAARADKGTPRSLPETAIRLIEGLALQTPPRSAASIHRQVTTIAKEQGWKPPSYARVRQIIKQLDPALVTFAHQGAAAYSEEFDLVGTPAAAAMVTAIGNWLARRNRASITIKRADEQIVVQHITSKQAGELAQLLVNKQ